MVMDVYDHLPPPRGQRFDDVYVLKVLSGEWNKQVDVRGVFDCLEAALHAMDHVRKYQYHNIVVDTETLVVTSRRRNSLVASEHTLVTWRRLPDGKPGVSNGILELCEGLRTHPVEPA